MRWTTATLLLAGGLLALTATLSGCASGDGVRERRRQHQADLASRLDDASGEEPPAGAEPGEEEEAGDAFAAREAAAAAEEEAAAGEGGVMAEGEEEEPAIDEPAVEEPVPADDEFAMEEPPPEEPSPRAGRRRAASDEEEVLSDLKEQLSLRQQEARYWADQGDGLASENRYEEAAKAYRRALDLDPTLDGAREGYNNALLQTGERGGEVGTAMEDLTSRAQVDREQMAAQIQRYLEEGQKAFEKGDVDRAENSVRLANDLIKVQPEADDSVRKQARDLLEEIRRKKTERARERETELLQETTRRAEEDLEGEKRAVQSQVQELLRKSAEFMHRRDYDKSIEACQRILELDPNNRIARFWLADSRDQLLNERRLRLIQNRLQNEDILDEAYIEAATPNEDPFTFPTREEWEVARSRARDVAISSVEDPEPVSRIKNALRQPVTFVWDNPLSEVVDQIRNLVGINIGLDPEIDATQTVKMQVTDLPAQSALNLLLEQIGATYTFKENILYITSPGKATGNQEFQVYPVSDILNKIRDFQGPELILRGPNEAAGEAPISFTAEATEEDTAIDDTKLIEVITSSIGQDVLGDTNTIEYHQGQLLVTATPEIHKQLMDVLESLRKDADLFVVIEARFIDITDDFLEDIGIDSRALGLVNNWGTPYGNQINSDRTGGQDLGFVKQGSPVKDVTLVMGQDRWAGRVQHIIDGFTGTVRGERLNADNGSSGLTVQATWLEPFQINTILRAVQEKLDVRQLTAPVITAHNGQRVYVSVITQRAYIADYELVSGGTGFAIIEVADPVVQTFQEGVILDVDPVIHHDKKYITLDVRPTLATLIGGVISTIQISLGSFTNVAFQVPIGVPEISLQQSFTSVTVPNGGTVLLGGFKNMSDQKFEAYLPLLGKIPLVENLFRRKSTLIEKRSLVILLTAKIVDLRGEETRQFNPE